MVHKLRLLCYTLALSAVSLIVYISIVDIAREPPVKVEYGHPPVEKRTSSRVRMRNKDGERLKNVAELKHGRKGNKQLFKKPQYSIPLIVDGDNKPHSAPHLTPNNTHKVTSPPFNQLALQTVRKSIINQLQCSHKYKDYYYAFTDSVDISTLAISPTRHHSSNRTGYIMSLTYREQQTKASENLFSLQCWAKTLRVYVVEPSVEDSHLIAPVNDDRVSKLRFRDVFDVVIWQRVTSTKGLPPLAGWDKFLQDAPRQMIVVYFKYPKYSSLKEHKESGKKMTHLATDDRYTKGCTISADLAGKINYMTTSHNFQVVRNVCVNFEFGDELTLFQFNTHVYAGLRPKEHTVVMEQWRGASDISSGNRVTIYDACWMPSQTQPFLFTWPSHRLVCDADKYKEKYLKSDQYIALMVRTEKFKIPGVDTNVSLISNCLNKTLQVWKDLKAKTKLKLTFVSMDVGKYGSYTLTDKKFLQEYQPYLPHFETFFKEIYGPLSSIGEWEDRFEAVASSYDSGYIGSLQKTLVAKARCVIFSGGGSFQKNAKYMYEKIHNKKCIRIVNKCTRSLS